MGSLQELLPLNKKNFEPFLVLNVKENRYYYLHLVMTDGQAVVFDRWEMKTKLVDAESPIWCLAESNA